MAARTSSFSFKGKATDVAEVARRLHVATVLEGSVRRAGSRVRVTVQLVDARNGFQLWSERYDRQMEDFAAPFDPRTRKLTGPERRVLEAIRPLTPPGDSERSFSFSDDGRLAYVAGPYAPTTPYSQLAWVDRAGHVERLPFEGPHAYDSLALRARRRSGGSTLTWAFAGGILISAFHEPSGPRCHVDVSAFSRASRPPPRAKRRLLSDPRRPQPDPDESRRPRCRSYVPCRC